MGLPVPMLTLVWQQKAICLSCGLLRQIVAYPKDDVGKPLPMEPDPEADEDDDDEVSLLSLTQHPPDTV